MTKTAEQNWLGFGVNFENVEDKTSESNFELLQEGFYKAEIKNVTKSIIGQKNTPALTVTLELEDGKKEMIHNLFLPQTGDEQASVDFKLQSLRNFFTRASYSNLTKDEYNTLDSKEKNDTLTKIQTNPKSGEQFIGSKVLVHVRQEPFIAQDKETGAIKFTDRPASYLMSAMTKPILKLISEKEKVGVDMAMMPVILFSNKIAAHGFGFYNDFNEDNVLKNSKSYDFIQENLANATAGATASTTVEKTATGKAIPNF